MQYNPDHFLHRIDVLERTIIAINATVNEQSDTVQQIQEQTSNQTEYAHQNYIRNGDFDLDRNHYLYEADFSDADGGTVDADVSEEAAFWYVSEPDTAVETTGSITAATDVVTIDGLKAEFEVGDVGAEIVVEGAGVGGADLVSTIKTYLTATTAQWFDAASTTVTEARVRFRLMEILEDSTDENADADNATNNTLKTEDHSRYATTENDPDYDKENGWVRMSSVNWLCAPLPQNYFKPSKSYVLSFIYRLASQIDSEDTTEADIFAGLWDNSPGQRKFLEGQPVELNANVVGTPAGTVSRDYFVVFYTSWGETIGSEVATVASAPNDASFITNSVYVNLEWTQPRGVIRTEIYRKTGSTYHLIKQPYPQSSARDAGTTIATVGGFPAVDYARAMAYIKSTPYNFSPPEYNNWKRAQFHIVVPPDYDNSKTTDKQWFVMGLTEVLTGTGADHALEVDLISIDDKYGTFSICPLDFFAKRGLSSAPTSGNQGNTGTGDPPILPGGCPAFDMPVLVERNGERLEVPAVQLVDHENIFRVVNRSGQAVRYKASVNPPQVVYAVLTTDGRYLEASASHPVFTSEQDVVGKSLSKIKIGDKILLRGGTLATVALNVRKTRKQHTVLIALESEDQGYWINDFGGHNNKTPEIT